MSPRLFLLAVLACAVYGPLAFAEDKAEFKRTLELAPADHIILDVTVSKGDVTISYSHAGEISITATARATDGKDLPAGFFDATLVVERDGMHVRVRSVPNAAYPIQGLRIAYTINVPDWIEVNSAVENGKQTIVGVRGPVKAISGTGDINVSYVTSEMEAKTGMGNITVVRVGTAARVETGGGNISLKDIGPASVATVRKGTGRIEMDGVSGSFTGSTDAGELDAKGGVYDNWDLKSVSGNIRITVAEGSKFEIDAVTRAGLLSVGNDDIEVPQGTDLRQCHKKVNGGGKLVRVRSDSGKIFIN